MDSDDSWFKSGSRLFRLIRACGRYDTARVHVCTKCLFDRWHQCGNRRHGRRHAVHKKQTPTSRNREEQNLAPAVVWHSTAAEHSKHPPAAPSLPGAPSLPAGPAAPGAPASKHSHRRRTDSPFNRATNATATTVQPKANAQAATHDGLRSNVQPRCNPLYATNCSTSATTRRARAAISPSQHHVRHHVRIALAFELQGKEVEQRLRD
jgi:hypothetical protein